MPNKLFQDNIETSQLRGTAGSRPWLRQEEEKEEVKKKEEKKKEEKEEEKKEEAEGGGNGTLHLIFVFFDLCTNLWQRFYKYLVSLDARN